MANNPRIEPYVRTANTLDKIGLSRQADNVEALMRVGMAMDAGKPLFNNVEEHRAYLDFLRDAKELVSSQTVNERTAGEKAFVLGEIDRYIELWSFMLEEDHKVRLAQKSLPFSVRFASNTDGELTPEQLSMLSRLAPVFRNIWLNGIRESFGQSDAGYTPRELNSIGSSIVKNLEMKSLDGREDISARSWNDKRQELARAKKMSEMERDPEQIIQVQFEGLSNLQTPEARKVTELLVSKQLEPMMKKAKTPEAKEIIATNAAALINWFLEPLPNIASTMSLVEEKARMVGMPHDVALPNGFFESSAGDPNTDGIRVLDEHEINHLSDRSNPEYAITNLQPSGAPLPPDEEMPFDETSGPQDETDAERALGLEEAPVEAPVTPQPKGRKGKQPAAIPVEAPVEEPVEEPVEAPVTPQPKGRKGKQPAAIPVEAPVEAPVDEPAEELVQPQPKRQKGKKPVSEPIQSPVGIDTPEDVPGTDIGMENTNISEQPTPDDESFVPSDEDIANESQGTDGAAPAENPKLTEEEKESAIMGEAAAAIIKDYRSKEGTSPTILKLLEELQDTVIAGTADEESAITALAILLNERNNVSISKISPHEPTVQWFKTKDNRGRLLEVAAYHMAQSLKLVSDEENAPGAEENAPIQEEHAPGTEATKPGQYDEEAEQPSTYDEGEDEEYRYTGPLPIEPKYLWARRLKKLVKFLAGMGLGAAAIWGIVTQLAPEGAAREAIQTVDIPQSEYSQPMQQQPEPQYTPPVQQEPQYTPPVQQPQYTPPVQQPAPQQQVPPVENPKRYNREYYRNFGDGDPRT